MSYIGQQPLNNFVTKQSQEFTPDGSTTGFTLNFAVTSGTDILLMINNVVQEPGAGNAYTASGTTLTMSEAPSASDSMYCIFLGLALQTVNPGDGSVGTAKLVDSAVTNAKIANSTIDLTTKVTGVLPAANGQTNTPFFYGEKASDQTLTRDTTTKITGLTQNELDSDSAFDGTTFTVPSGKAGKYYIEMIVYGVYSSVGNDGEFTQVMLYKNGSQVKANAYYDQATDQREFGVTVSAILDLAVGDTIEMYGKLRDFDSGNARVSEDLTSVLGYRLIT